MSEKSEENDQPIPAEVVEIIPAQDWRLREYTADHPFPPLTPPHPPRRRILLPVMLFILTALSTFFAYSFFFADSSPPHRVVGESLRYTFAIMTILFCHEMGHFLQAWRYEVQASLPYFIPMPFSPFGTMGAVIVMKARMGSRRSLFDIGISGPLAGLIPTIIFCWIGIQTASTVMANGKGLSLPEPLLFQWLASFLRPLPEGFTFSIKNPYLFAGWVGMFITSLNLIPIGQLDGGHVLYALLRKKSYFVVRLLVMVFILSIFIFNLWPWIVFLLLLLFLGLFHPPTANDQEKLDWFRTVLGILLLLFLPLGFTFPPVFN
jgi:membrane-associated protease RseP (regulator of RpoE activity)